MVTRYRYADPDNRSFILRDIIRENINALDSDGDTALMIAAELGHLDDVKTLLSSKGININFKNNYGHTALMKALDKNHKEIAKQLIRDGAKILPWMRCTFFGFKEIEKELAEEM